MWETETIPDIDTVFCRIHTTLYSKKRCLPSESAFRNTPADGDNLSCEWDEYASEDDCRNFVLKLLHHKTGKPRNPLDYFVFKMNVGDIRALTPYPQEVKHDPIFHDPELSDVPNNRAHAIIIGNKGDKNDTELRLKMVDIGAWAIRPDDCVAT